jgi:hypothetical protein
MISNIASTAERNRPTLAAHGTSVGAVADVPSSEGQLPVESRGEDLCSSI